MFIYNGTLKIFFLFVYIVAPSQKKYFLDPINRDQRPICKKRKTGAFL